jgi:hypothetical protein
VREGIVASIFSSKNVSSGSAPKIQRCEDVDGDVVSQVDASVEVVSKSLRVGVKLTASVMATGDSSSVVARTRAPEVVGSISTVTSSGATELIKFTVDTGCSSVSTTYTGEDGLGEVESRVASTEELGTNEASSSSACGVGTVVGVVTVEGVDSGPAAEACPEVGMEDED